MILQIKYAYNDPRRTNSETEPAEVVLEHVAVDHVVLKLHLEGLHGGLQVGETASLGGGQGHRFHDSMSGLACLGLAVMLCSKHT